MTRWMVGLIVAVGCSSPATSGSSSSSESGESSGTAAGSGEAGSTSASVGDLDSSSGSSGGDETSMAVDSSETSSSGGSECVLIDFERFDAGTTVQGCVSHPWSVEGITFDTAFGDICVIVPNDDFGSKHLQIDLIAGGATITSETGIASFRAEIAVSDPQQLLSPDAYEILELHADGVLLDSWQFAKSDPPLDTGVVEVHAPVLELRIGDTSTDARVAFDDVEICVE